MQLLFVTSTMVFGYSTICLIVCIYRYSAAGPDLADARPYKANPLARPSLPLLRGNNGTALISLRKAEDYDTDPLKVQSIKNYKSLPEFPTITALVAAFDAKAFSDTELLKSYLDGGNRIINFCSQINRKRLG